MMRVRPLTHNPILCESFTYRWFIKHLGVFPEEGGCVLPWTTIMKPWSWHCTVLKLEACNSTPKYEWFWFSFYFEFISQLEIPLLPVTTFQRILGQEHSRPAFGGVADTKPSKCWRCSVTLPSPLYLQKSQPPDVPRMLIFQDASKYFIIDKNSSFSFFSLLSLFTSVLPKEKYKAKGFCKWTAELQPPKKTAGLFLLGVWFTERGK